jgi:hypothetical protein
MNGTTTTGSMPAGFCLNQPTDQELGRIAQKVAATAVESIFEKISCGSALNAVRNSEPPKPSALAALQEIDKTLLKSCSSPRSQAVVSKISSDFRISKEAVIELDRLHEDEVKLKLDRLVDDVREGRKSITVVVYKEETDSQRGGYSMYPLHGKGSAYLEQCAYLLIGGNAVEKSDVLDRLNPGETIYSLDSNIDDFDFGFNFNFGNLNDLILREI